MKTAAFAAAALIAAFALPGTASAKDLVAPHATHAAKASPRVVDTRRPAKKPILDFTSTQSIMRADDKPVNGSRKAPSVHNGIMVNPWIVPNIL